MNTAATTRRNDNLNAAARKRENCCEGCPFAKLHLSLTPCRECRPCGECEECEVTPTAAVCYQAV